MALVDNLIDRALKSQEQLKKMQSLLFRIQTVEQKLDPLDVRGLLDAIDEICSVLKDAAVLQSDGSTKTATSFESDLDIDTARKTLVEIREQLESIFLDREVPLPRKKAKQLLEAQRRLKATFHFILHPAFILDTARRAEEMNQKTADIRKLQVLPVLQRFEMNIDTRVRCRDGEYASTRSSIRAWATSPGQEKNIMWLRSPAEDRKSGARIVITLFDEFQKARQLGGHVFFSPSDLELRNNDFPNDPRPKPASSDPSRAFQSLAAQLIKNDFHPPLTEDIVRRAHTDLRQICERWPLEQFKKLLLDPFLANAPTGPVIFLLDGLDHCGAAEGEYEIYGKRKALVEVLRILVEGSARFPPNVRLLISGGEGMAIRRLLDGCDRVMQLEVPA
ncbi:hypothetical protein C8R46DRAFT_1024140 [Mycena filopes]|nr:hypothetical protein C8R46DRAFT_1024140 [Mycena filopes]